MKDYETKKYVITDIGTKPIEDIIFTLNEVADAVGYTTNGLMIAIKKLNIPYTKHKPLYCGGPCIDITYEAYKQIKNYVQVQNEKKARIEAIKKAGKIAEEKKKLLDLEQLKQMHPLVIDERFFKESFFPDITPVCFMEM